MTTYYVDATGGDDGALGTSEGTAWKTVAKVNGSAFNPGDSVLFKRGEAWAGTCLTIPSSGSATGGAITFGAYGSGVKPRLDGNDVADACAATNKQHLAFEDLDFAQGFSFSLALTNCQHVTITDCDCHDAGNDNLLIEGSSSVKVTGGVFHSGYPRVVGPIITGIEIADGSHDVIVEDVVCRSQSGTSGTGLSIHAHTGETMPYNLLVRNSAFHDNSAYGIHIQKQVGVADGDGHIQIQDCRVYDNTLDQFRIWKTGAAYVSGVIVDRCFFSGGRYVLYLQGDDIVVRRSVIQEGRVARVDGCDGVAFYNCTFYLTTYTSDFALFQGIDSEARGTLDVTLRNCIFASPDATAMMYKFGAGLPTSATIDDNLYTASATATRWQWNGTNYNWADWKTNSAQDASSPDPADPLFVSVPADDFRLQAASPAIGAGADVGLFYSGDAPDLGAYEHWASRGATSLHLAAAGEEA